jgi:hypothetical protein
MTGACVVFMLVFESVGRNLPLADIGNCFDLPKIFVSYKMYQF